MVDDVEVFCVACATTSVISRTFCWKKAISSVLRMGFSLSHSIHLAAFQPFGLGTLVKLGWRLLCRLTSSRRQSTDGLISFFLRPVKGASLKSRSGFLDPSSSPLVKPMQRATSVVNLFDCSTSTRLASQTSPVGGSGLVRRGCSSMPLVGGVGGDASDWETEVEDDREDMVC